MMVADILDNPTAYHGQTCRDPEEHDYGSSSVAKLYTDGYRPMIHSFAHGGRKYYLRAEPFAAASADEFDAIHTIQRAQRMVSVDRIIPPEQLRPYVIDGLPAVSLREADGQRWLELAVHSVEDARPAGAAPVPTACPAR